MVIHPAAETNPPVDLHLPHVLHIASGDLWAGAEVQLYTLAKSLTDLNVRVTVALLNYGMLEEKLRTAGITVHVFDETITNAFGIILALKRLVLTEGVEVVHTHRMKENILGSIAATLAGGIPSIRTVHGDSEHWPSWWQLHKFAMIYLDQLTGRHLQHSIISVSEELAARIGKIYQADKITAIPNGIIIPVTRTANPRPMSDLFRIGIAGRLVAVKRADLFIRAARLFTDQHPDIRAEFCLYGDGPLRYELELLSKELGTDKIVKFAGHKNEMNTEFADLDALMLTSDHEGLPMILLEAMANGIPVVAHAVGGIPDVMNQGDCGVLVTDHTPNGYAEALFQLLTDTHLRNGIVSRATQRVIAHYNAEQNARRYLANYLSIHKQATV